MNKKFLILLVALFGTAGAAGTYFVTSYSSFTSWFSTIATGIVASAMLVSVYFIIGHLLRNNRIIESAKAEYVQAIGTAIILVIIIVFLNFFGSALQFSQLTTPAQMTNICNTLDGSQINLISGNFVGTTADGGIAPSPANLICNGIIQGRSVGGTTIDPTTRSLDYGLGATYLIYSNLTNETASALDSLYTFQSMVGFLSTYTPSVFICWAAAPGICDIPLVNIGSEFQIDFSYKPYAGYTSNLVTTPVITGGLLLGLYVLLVNLLFIVIVFIAWPYMLAGGMILRSFTFTRGLGGLLIALVIGTLLIYPFLVMFEYNGLSNVSIFPIGTASDSNLVLCGTPVNAPAAGFSTGVFNGGGTPTDGTYCYTNAASLPANSLFRDNVFNFNGIPAPIIQGFGLVAGGLLTAAPISHVIQKSYGGADTIPACASGATPGGPSAECYQQRGINLFVPPKVQDIINFYSYWPGDNIVLFEIEYAGLNILGPVQSTLLSPLNILLLFSGDANLFTLLNPIATAFHIDPISIYNAIIGLMQTYAIYVIADVIFPTINLIIVFGSISGISAMLGGETRIFGLAGLL